MSGEGIREYENGTIDEVVYNIKSVSLLDTVVTCRKSWRGSVVPASDTVLKFALRGNVKAANNLIPVIYVKPSTGQVANL